MKYDKGQVSRGVVSFIFLTILALFVIHIYITLNLPIFNNPEKKIIEIPKGMTINEISFLLKKEKIIKNIWLFKLLTKIRWGMIIKAGEYQLTSSMNMLHLLDQILLDLDNVERGEEGAQLAVEPRQFFLGDANTERILCVIRHGC